MPVVSGAEFLKAARKGGYAVGGFNTNNLEWTQAILEAAEAKQAPVLIQTSMGAAKYMGGYKICKDLITDLVEAKLAESNEAPGRNITGTSDMVPIDKQIQLLLSIVPDAKTIGIMYNAGEANSKIQADLAEKALKDAGVDVKVLTANTTNDVQQVTTSLAKDVDGIYVPTDNTFASAAAVVGEVAKETKTPIVAGSVEQVEDGALATFGIDYKSLGKQTGELAAKILDGDEKPATTPVETANKLELVVNQKMATALGIDPESIVAPE